MLRHAFRATGARPLAWCRALAPIPEVLLPAAALPPDVVPDLARIGMLALPGSLSVALAEWEKLGEDERENAAAEVRRLAALIEAR